MKQGQITNTEMQLEVEVEIDLEQSASRRDADNKNVSRNHDSESDSESALPLSAPRIALTQAQVLEPLRALYRGPGYASHGDGESYVAFARKTTTGEFQNLCSLTLEDLERDFDTLAPYLTHDAYYSVNGLYRPAPYRSDITGLPGVWRQEKHLRFLNTCTSDIDVGREFGTPAQCMTEDEAAQEVLAMLRARSLPKCSMTVRSGRGLYLFWFLCDDRARERPPRAYPENLILYKRIQRAIAKRLRHLAADPQAIDASRIFRVAGTLHSKNGRPARYKIWRDGLYHLAPAYTFRELAEAFDVSAEVKANEKISKSVWDYGRKTVHRGSAPERERGPRTRDKNRAADLFLLEQHRGGWPKGCRLKRLRLLASLLKGAGLQLQAVDAAVRRSARKCRPPYPSDPNDTPLKDIASTVFKEALIVPSTDTLCTWLDVTPALARQLNLQSIVPAEVRHERMPVVGGQRALNREKRYQAIKAYVAAHGLQPCRTVAHALRDQGIQASDWTINNDLNILGLRQADPCPGRTVYPESNS